MAAEHARAVHYFTRALETDPQFRLARVSRAILLGRELGQAEAAFADFDALLADDAHYAPALLNRGLLFQQHGRYREALTDLEAYLDLPESKEHGEEALRITIVLREILTDLEAD